MPKLIQIIVLVMCVAAGTTATADTPRKPGGAEAVRQAKARFKQGEAFLRQKLYDQAIAEYEAAYELAPLPELVFNIAEAYNLKADTPAGKPSDKDKALEMYTKYLAIQSEGPVADQARISVAVLTRDKQARDEVERKRVAEEEARRAAVEATRVADAAAAVERDRQEVLRKLRETEETKRREEEAVRKADADRVAAEIARREAIVSGERDEWNNRRNKRTKRRKQGYRIAGIGIGCASVAAVFAALGANTNSAIEGGGFASAADISSKVTQGKVFNDLAIGFGIAGGVGVAVGTTLVVLHWDIGGFKIGASASGEVKAIVLTGSLP